MTYLWVFIIIIITKKILAHRLEIDLLNPTFQNKVCQNTKMFRETSKFQLPKVNKIASSSNNKLLHEKIVNKNERENVDYNSRMDMNIIIE